MKRDIGGLREFVEMLEKQGDVRRIRQTVDPRFEAAAILTRLDREGGPAVLFESVNGHSMPVIGNLLAAPRRLASALFMTEEMLRNGQLPPNHEQLIDPVLVDGDGGRRVITSSNGFDIRQYLPVLTHYTRDSAPFITCGVASARDPEGGGMRRGLHRVEVRGTKELGISLVNPPLAGIYKAHQSAGTPMEIAIAIGVDPAVLLSSVFKCPPTMDKLCAAGGLTGTPIQLMKAHTVDLEIPAQAEVVIEGVIDPHVPEKEGVLGEVSGYYLAFSSPSIRITAVTFREHPYFQALLPQGSEVDLLLAFIHGLNVIPKMKMLFPSMLDLHFTPGTFGSHLVMAMNSDKPGETRQALTMALSIQSIKKAVIVNEDVDIRDPLAVEWALATRFQADKDLMVIPGLGGQVLDPSAGKDYTTTKIGLDATHPHREGFEKIDFPENARKSAMKFEIATTKGVK